MTNDSIDARAPANQRARRVAENKQNVLRSRSKRNSYNNNSEIIRTLTSRTLNTDNLATSQEQHCSTSQQLHQDSQSDDVPRTFGFRVKLRRRRLGHSRTDRIFTVKTCRVEGVKPKKKRNKKNKTNEERTVEEYRRGECR